jgi:hypothetical protein
MENSSQVNNNKGSFCTETWSAQCNAIATIIMDKKTNIAELK